MHDLESILGPFLQPKLLQEALTHRSYLNENPECQVPDNERLEFLGDAVLSYLAADYIFCHFPEMQEGEMTVLRAALVKTESLASLAMRWDVGKHLLLGRGEEASGGRARPANLCAAVEALIGALYLDRGLEAVLQAVMPYIAAEAESMLSATQQVAVENSLPIRDAKSRLQELAQSKFHLTPSYRMVAERGPDHEKEFTMEVLIGHVARGRGVGRSKQAAEQAAAQEALVWLENKDRAGEEVA